MSNQSAHLGISLDYIPPGGVRTTMTPIAITIPYQAVAVSRADVPDTSIQGTTVDVDFGAVGVDAGLVLVKNGCSVDLGVCENAPAGIAVTPDASGDTFTAGAAHGLVAGDVVYLTATVAVPTGGPASGVAAHVIASGLTPTVFKLSLSEGGATYNLSDIGTGVVSVHRKVPAVTHVIPPGGVKLLGAAAEGSSDHLLSMRLTLMGAQVGDGFVDSWVLGDQT